MRRGNKCSYIYLILINRYPISLFSDSPYINQLLQITRKLSLGYTSKASRFHVSQLLKGASTGGNEQGPCFPNRSGENTPLSSTVPSASHPERTGSRRLRRFLFRALPLVSAPLGRRKTCTVPQRSFPECGSGCAPTDAPETKRQT